MDAIIVNPVDTNAVKPIMDQATKAGIPLVFVNRRPQAELTDKMAYVGSDSILAGRLQMEALAKAMNGKGNVAILLGDLANESTRDRTKGGGRGGGEIPEHQNRPEADREIYPQ
ncbi:substrate-binding domain-containing protein [Klebsiella variicola subsp. variicola]|nr:substrate-binding domain-containing protein [Klebsiella variicola subsp. variicola]